MTNCVFWFCGSFQYFVYESHAMSKANPTRQKDNKK